MDNTAIEERAHKLLGRIWKQRTTLTGKAEPQPIEVVEPEYAAQVLGFELVFVESMGRFGGFEAAGYLNRDRRLVLVSNRLGAEAARFTAAHEVGHWVLHQETTVFRERPIKGLSPASYTRPGPEREADCFAGHFLMPRKLVEDEFVARFKAKPFVFDDRSAFHLGHGDPDAILRPRADQRSRATALASATSYDSNHFDSLAAKFRVSISSMAIQLEELGLFQDWP